MAAGDNTFNNALSIIEAGGAPTWTPTATQSHWAREADTEIFWIYNTGTTAWESFSIDYVKAHGDAILTDNEVSLSTQLQNLSTAIQAIAQDGNNYPISRAGAVEDVQPTVGEVASPVAGDTADVYLQGGPILEIWVYDLSWTKAISIDLAPTATNLAYTASPTDGTVTSSTGTDSTLPLADGTNAGLIAPAEKANIAANVTDIAEMRTMTGTADGDTNMGTYTGSIITDSGTTKANIQELETDLEALQTASGLAAGATDNGTFTGTTISDGVSTKVALQELETALETKTDDQTAAEVSVADAGGLYTGTTAEAALQEVGQDAADLRTSVGTADGAVNMGTYTGTTITDNQTIKQNLQELETAVENAGLLKTVTDTNSVDLTLSGAGDLQADIILDPTQDNANEITVSATGVRITPQNLTAYASHALADAAVAAGQSYILTAANIEGVPSDGNSGPVFRRV